jgi:hypothetical protein
VTHSAAAVELPGERTSLKGRAGVKPVSSWGFGVCALCTGRGELTPCIPFPRCCLFRARGRP